MKKRIPERKLKKWKKGKVKVPIWACWSKAEIEDARREAEKIRKEIHWY